MTSSTENSLQSLPNQIVSTQLLSVLRGRRFTRPNEKLGGLVVATFLFAIFRLGLGVYCISSEDNCNKSTSISPADREFEIEYNLFIGTIAVIIGVFLSVYNCTERRAILGPIC